jgi:hypothetical protein
MVEFLVIEGKRDEARTIAARQGEDALRVIVEASYAHFGKALSIARTAMSGAAPTAEGSYVAFYTALFAAGVSDVLGGAPDFVDGLVARYFDPEPSPANRGFVMQYAAPFVCAHAPPAVARRCFKKLHEIFPGDLASSEGLVEGAERFAQHDYAGAARAWRPLARKPGIEAIWYGDLFATAFERAGDTDLAEKLDALTVAKPGRYNGAELAYVRSARRAEKRGDKETARKLARAVVDAWGVADTDVPVVLEMRKLLARIERKEGDVAGLGLDDHAADHGAVLIVHQLADLQDFGTGRGGHSL